MRKVMCPLLGKEIDGDGECFDISMVVEDGAPRDTAPREAFEKDNFREICLGCKNHISD